VTSKENPKHNVLLT